MAEKIRTLTMVLAALLCGGLAFAQIDYRPPSGGGTGSADPAQFSSAAGTLTIGGSVGAVTIDADTSVIPTYASGTSSPGATCSPGQFYFETDLTLHICKATNTWAQLFTFVDDSIMLGTGTATAVKAIPDCDDTTGNHLNYDTTTNAFSCGTSGGSSSFDPGTVIEMYEDFVSGTTTAGGVGTTGAGVVAIASGTPSQIAGTGTNNPGIFRLNSHATNDNSGEVVYFGNGNTTNSWPPGVYTATGDWTFDAVVAIGTNSTAITNTAFFAGIIGTYSSDISNNTASAIMVRRDTDLSETGAFKFVICNASGAAGCNSAADAANAKVMASTISPSAGTYYRIRIRRLASGVGGNETIYFRINAETEKTACSSGCDTTLATKPTTGLTPAIQYLTRTTTGVMSADVDYMYFRLPGLSRY